MILALEEAKYRLENFRANIEELGNALRIDELTAKVAVLEETTTAENFWNDQENSSKVLRQIKQMKDKIAEYHALEGRLEDTIALAELAIEANDETMVPEVESEIKAIEEEDKRLQEEEAKAIEPEHIDALDDLDDAEEEPEKKPLVKRLGKK